MATKKKYFDNYIEFGSTSLLKVIQKSRSVSYVTRLLVLMQHNITYIQHSIVYFVATTTQFQLISSRKSKRHTISKKAAVKI